MQALNAFLQLLLVIAVFLYFIGFIASPVRWQSWRWAAILVGAVFAIALLFVEAHAHPIAAVVSLLCASFAAYRIVEARKAHRTVGNRHVPPTFLNLRVTGKTPVEIEEREPLPNHEEEEEQ
jgi:ABC-type multidrug transport system permease subunit